MLHEFLKVNRAVLVERCRIKVALRPAPRPTLREIEHGIPLFLSQLIDTLHIEQGPYPLESRRVSGPSAPGKKHEPSEIGTSAAKH